MSPAEEARSGVERRRRFFDVLAHLKEDHRPSGGQSGEPNVGRPDDAGPATGPESSTVQTSFYDQCVAGLARSFRGRAQVARAVWNLRWRRAKANRPRITEGTLAAGLGGMIFAVVGTGLALLTAKDHLLSSWQGVGIGATFGVMPGAFGIPYFIFVFMGLGGEVLRKTRPLLGRMLGGAVGGLIGGGLVAVVLTGRNDMFGTIIWMPAGFVCGFVVALVVAGVESRYERRALVVFAAMFFTGSSQGSVQLWPV